jgi:hypothetical protein
MEMDWYALQTALAEALVVLAISLPITWFFYGWAMAVVDATTSQE